MSQARDSVAFNQDVKALVPTGIDETLLLFSLLDAQQALHGRVESSGHGTGRLPTEFLLGQEITMPDPSSQRRLAGPLRNLNDRIAAAGAESRTLSALRDVLLPDLISGELRLDDPEPILRRLEPTPAATTAEPSVAERRWGLEGRA